MLSQVGHDFLEGSICVLLCFVFPIAANKMPRTKPTLSIEE